MSGNLDQIQDEEHDPAAVVYLSSPAFKHISFRSVNGIKYRLDFRNHLEVVANLYFRLWTSSPELYGTRPLSEKSGLCLRRLWHLVSRQKLTSKVFLSSHACGRNLPVAVTTNMISSCHHTVNYKAVAWQHRKQSCTLVLGRFDGERGMVNSTTRGMMRRKLDGLFYF